MKALRRIWKKSNWLASCSSRKTVEDMRLGNGLRQAEAQNIKTPPTERVKKYYPNAQVILDGKEVDVLDKDQSYRVTMEFCKDIASDHNSSMTLSQTENYELVKKALYEHMDQHGFPLSALVDNGPANRTLAIELDKNDRILIFARPYRPQSRGNIEKEFGIFEKQLSRIEIKGEKDQEIVMSIVAVIARTYLRLRNQTPRCSNCPMTPEKLMHYQPSDLECEKAYRAQVIERDKRREQQEKTLKIAEEKLALIESVVENHQLTGDRLLLKKALRHVEMAAIREAESRFYVSSQRDIFDPSKRTMAYFCKIALNVQQERDNQQCQEIAQRRYRLDQQSRKMREDRAAEIKLRAEQRRQQKQPELIIGQSFAVYGKLPEEFRRHKSFWRPLLDQGIHLILKRRNQNRRRELVDRSRLMILQQNWAPLELRYKFISIVESYMLELGLNLAKSVTPN